MPKDRKTFDDRLWDTVVQLILWVTLGCASFLILFAFDINNGRVGFRQDNSWPEVMWALALGIIVFRFYFGNNSFIAALLSDEHAAGVRAFHIFFVFLQLFIQLLATISVSSIWISVLLTATLFLSDVVWYALGGLFGGEAVQDDLVMRQNQINNFLFSLSCLIYILYFFAFDASQYGDMFLTVLLCAFIVNLVVDLFINRSRYF